MILPKLFLAGRAYQQLNFSGIDSIHNCLDKGYFQKYPHHIDYSFNSRGFRDQEWPNNSKDLYDAIWCIGDSFTVGIGQPLEHTWPYLLSERTGRRTINVSMDGASNDWISRKAIDILEAVGPKHMVIMWSYAHRREHKNNALNDENRRLHMSSCNHLMDAQHFVRSVESLAQAGHQCIHVTIPEFFHPIDTQIVQRTWQDVADKSWPTCPQTLAEYLRLPDVIKKELEQLDQCADFIQQKLACTDVIVPCLSNHDIIVIRCMLDYARDHHHFDILTAEWVVDQILPRLVD